MMRRRRKWIATLVLPAALVAAACEDGSADPGAACVQGGGVCSGSAVVCRESLPYPCPGSQTCCIPFPPRDAGGG